MLLSFFVQTNQMIVMGMCIFYKKYVLQFVEMCDKMIT